MDAGDAFDARNTIAFEQHREDGFRLLDGQIHAVQGVVTGIREYLAALGALEALTVSALTELPAVYPAIVTGHVDLDLSSGPVQNGSGRLIPSSGFGLRLNPVGSCNSLPDLVSSSGPCRVRTGDLPVSTRTLYPTELRGRINQLHLPNCFHGQPVQILVRLYTI